MVFLRWVATKSSLSQAGSQRCQLRAGTSRVSAYTEEVVLMVPIYKAVQRTTDGLGRCAFGCRFSRLEPRNEPSGDETNDGRKRSPASTTQQALAVGRITAGYPGSTA